MRRSVPVLAAALLAAPLLAAPAAQAAPPTTLPSAAHVWLTTPDKAHLLDDMGTVAFRDATSDQQTLVVDPSRTYQTMTGFGGSLTDSSATVIAGLAPAQRDALMHRLFDPATGDGLDFLRQPIGASDFVADRDYTFDDVPAGQTDYDQQHFSVAHDETTILPLLRQALAINPDITVMATPWSPPAWMKTGGSLVGGRLIDDPRVYRSYALYLTKFVQAYAAAGVPVDYLSVQNEPQNRAPSGYPGTDLSSAQEVKVIEALGPMLRAAHLDTKILAYDHNWSEHPDDVAITPPDETRDTDAYPQNVLATRARRYVAGVAYHCYYGDPSAMTALHAQYPREDVFFTECSGSESSDPANTFNDTLRFDARTLEIGATRNWAKSVVNWNLALDPAGGPHVGGCDTCTGIVTVAADGTVTPDAEYYALGHLSRFVRPGAVRIGSTSFGTAAYNGELMDVAFRNPDGSTVLVVHNENDAARSFTVREGDASLDYTLPGGALATFVWDGDASGVLTSVDPRGWTATANPPGPSDPCCSGDVAAHAVDDDASTRYSTGQAQAPGESLTVDFGRTLHRLDRVVFDTGASTGDYPRGYRAEISTDGTTWTTVPASGAGQFTDLDLGHATARYVRLTLTASSGSWWSVADVRAYRRR